MSDSISFFPVDNGTTIMIKVDCIRALVDLHHRKKTEDDEDLFDIKSQIVSECLENTLDYFILTHPHDDHARGFDDVFHCGAPDTKSKSAILVKEIICTEYTAGLTAPNDTIKPLIKEIQRRANLSEDDRKKAGNRLSIVGEGDQITLSEKMIGTILSPSSTELKVVKEASEEEGGSAINNTALCVMWKYNNDCQILLGSDAENAVWERINKKYSEEDLSWQLCEAGHHCSRSVFANKVDEKYEDNESAIEALSHLDGAGFVVASSKQIKKNDDNPPSWEAKQKWISILETQGGGDAKSRFWCTADNKNSDGTLEPTVFLLDKKGVTRKSRPVSEKVAKASVAGFERPVSYGS